MNHASIRSVFIVVMLVTAAGLADGQARDPLDELFARGRAAQAAMSQLTASFTEQSVSPLLVDPIVSTGTVSARRQPLHVVMQYAGPEPRTVTLDQKTLVVTWPDRPEREVVNIAAIQARVERYFVDATAGELRRSFDITLASDPDVRGGTERLTMVPKRRQITEGLSRLDLWIDPRRLLLVQMRMEFPGGDTKVFDFSEFDVTRAGAAAPPRLFPAAPGHAARP
jgi:hypothetical protein